MPDCGPCLTACTRADPERASASGDGTGIMAILNDPAAVQICVDAGLGKHVSIEVGGKLDGYHGKPVQFSGLISHLSSGKFDLENENSHQASMLGTHIDMGPCAVIVNLVDHVSDINCTFARKRLHRRAIAG